MTVEQVVKIKGYDMIVVDMCDYTGKTVYSRGIYVTFMTEYELRAAVYRVEEFYNGVGVVNSVIHAYMGYDDLMKYLEEQKGDQKDDS